MACTHLTEAPIFSHDIESNDRKRARYEWRGMIWKKELQSINSIFCVLHVKGDEFFIGTLTGLYHWVDGRVSLIAGHSIENGYCDGIREDARFDEIRGLALETSGSILVCDSCNNVVRRVSRLGYVSTLAGSGECGHADGVGVAALFDTPEDIEVDRNGMIYVADTCNNCIRTVNPVNGTVKTLCGKGREYGMIDGPFEDARFHFPQGLAWDMNNCLIVSDYGNNNIRKVDLSVCRVTTLAGSTKGEHESAGHVNDKGISARFISPRYVEVDGENNIFVCEKGSLRKISSNDRAVTNVTYNAECKMVDWEEVNCFLGRIEHFITDDKGRLICVDKHENIITCFDFGLKKKLNRYSHRQNVAQLCSSNLRKDLTVLLGSGIDTDLTIQVEGRDFHVHRAILKIRSDFMQKMLDFNSENSEQTRKVKIPDMKASVFEVVLRFLYTNEIPSVLNDRSDFSFWEFSKAVDFMMITELQSHCKTHFVKILDVADVIKYLIEARDHGLTDFEELAIEFLQDHIVEFQILAIDTIDVFEQRHDLMSLFVKVTKAILNYSEITGVVDKTNGEEKP